MAFSILSVAEKPLSKIFQLILPTRCAVALRLQLAAVPHGHPHMILFEPHPQMRAILLARLAGPVPEKRPAPRADLACRG